MAIISGGTQTTITPPLSVDNTSRGILGIPTLSSTTGAMYMASTPKLHTSSLEYILRNLEENTNANLSLLERMFNESIKYRDLEDYQEYYPQGITNRSI